MSSHQDPIEPDDVIDSTRRTPRERVRSAADRAFDAAGSRMRSVREATRTSHLIGVTESSVNRALGGVSHAIDEAVRSGRIERAFDRAQQTVTSGADGVRRLVERRSE